MDEDGGAAVVAGAEVVAGVEVDDSRGAEVVVGPEVVAVEDDVAVVVVVGRAVVETVPNGARVVVVVPVARVVTGASTVVPGRGVELFSPLLVLVPAGSGGRVDEPTTGMDVEGRRSFWGAIREDAERGRTILFATHYLEEADQYADRVVLISHGRVVADGSGSEIKALASGRIVRATLPDAEQHRLEALPGVESLELRGDTVYIHARDTDAIARHLLTATPAKDLEITAKGLEEAFLSLTGTHDTAKETR